jgi:hypothetical protein
MNVLIYRLFMLSILKTLYAVKPLYAEHVDN